MWKIKPRDCPAILEERRLVAEGTYELSFKPVIEGWIFRPGQYIWIELPQMKREDAKGNRRAFSILNSPGEGVVKVMFRESQSGYKQNILDLETGTKVILDGPFGFLEFPDEKNIEVVMIANGTGVAPFLSMLRSVNLDERKANVDLYYSYAAAEKEAYLPELRKLQDSKKSFKLHEVAGEFDIEVLQNNTTGVNGKKWFIVGSDQMVEGVLKWLKSRGVSEELIHFEQFSDRYSLNPDNSLTEMLGVAVRFSAEHVVITDVNGRVVFANPAAETITGYTLDEMRGETPRLWGGLMPSEYYKVMWNTVKQDKRPFEGEIVNRRKSGKLYWAKIKIAPFLDKNGELLGFVSNEDDITDEKETDRLKTEFISLASHQLRTPLTSIRWNLELVKTKTGEMDGEWKKKLEAAYQATLRMADLVNGLLNITRTESGRLAVRPVRINIADLLTKVVDDVKPLADRRKLVILTNVSEDAREIVADPKLLEHVYLSLLSNAIKYSPENKQILVNVKRTDNNQVLSEIKDEGIGIPKQVKDRIFEKFFRADNAVVWENDGNGLGLYLAKQIIGVCGGKLWFESVENIGSSFYFVLPAEMVTAKSGEAGLERQMEY